MVEWRWGKGWDRMEEATRLGRRYELGEILGRGGMAEVFMARDIRLGRAVAVKTLRADMARDATFQARFRREAQSAASLNHPAVVAVYDTGEDTIGGIPLPYIVMEYVDGTTLRDVLHSGRRLLPERAMEIAAGILQALDYSHRNGIVHRDIKPANIMLNRNGAVKVMDFGIARAMGDMSMTLTQTSAVIGTAQYLSPEQAKGERADARSDLYSTGCLLYELLTGRPPFIGDSPVAVAYQHVREAPQPPSYYDPEVPAVADAIVIKALGKRPDERYQSADEMRADLDRALDGRPILAPYVSKGGSQPDASPTTALPTAGGNGAAAKGTAVKGTGVKGTGAKGTGAKGVGVIGSGVAATARDSADLSQTSLEPSGDDPDDTALPRRGGPDGGGRGWKSSPKTLYAILGAVAVVLVILAVIALNPGSTGVSGDVPSIVNMSVTDASRTLAAKDLKLASASDCSGTAASSTTYPAGKIMNQYPSSTATMIAGETVNYCVSAGYPGRLLDFSTAQLGGLSYQAVYAVLHGDGFTVQEQQVVDNAASGTVLDVQDANGDTLLGKTVPLNQTLFVVVSSGPDSVLVPPEVDQNCAAGTAQIQRAGFQTKPNTAYSGFVRQGLIISTSPGGNAPTPLTQTVTVTCSLGPPPVRSTPTSPPTSPPPSATPTPTPTLSLPL
jgi:beta-lactam-binding protein with PASTA domain/predicted Ser/Thr protein kinase